MKKNIQIRVLVLALSALSFSVAYTAYTQQHHAKTTNIEYIIPSKIPGLPVRLKIPSIGVNSLVESVGITQDGTMGVPNNPSGVGWFDLGPRPGEMGNAVIAGHLNTEEDAEGVFTHLHTLKIGDRLYIEDSAGISHTFNVRESRTYDPGHADDVFALSDSAHLNLITCAGTWNEENNSYTKRLVVFADNI